jgi:hypothetical protein
MHSGSPNSCDFLLHADLTRVSMNVEAISITILNKVKIQGLLVDFCLSASYFPASQTRKVLKVRLRRLKL